MDLYEIQRAITAEGLAGLEALPVKFQSGKSEVDVGTAELKYDGNGFPYVLLAGNP